jgi:hypothetical protein
MKKIKKKVKSKKPNLGGRPLVEINWAEFDRLCQIQATLEEISSWFKCSVDTIERACEREKNMGFAEYYRQNAGTGKVSLRRQQWQLALKGDKTMLIWLGKQHLGQAEKQEVDQKTDLNVHGDVKVVLTMPANGSEADK